MRAKIVCISMFFIFMTSVSWGGDDHAEVKKMFLSANGPIEFYGRVVDQNSDPVAEAQVIISISAYSAPITTYGIKVDVKDVILKTDKRGNFELHNERGTSLHLLKIEKKGFVFLYDDKQVDYYYSPAAEKKHHPDKANPVIFKMRKKEPPTFVIPGGFGLSFVQGEVEKEIDLVTRRATELGKLGTSKFLKNEHVDIRIKAKMSEDKANYNITFNTPDDNSGIVERAELLYVVPEEGYKPSKTVTVPVTSQVKKYIYIKSRKGSVYARLDIEIKANKENISLSIKSWTNSNGERNVDFDDAFYGEEKKRRAEESKRKAIEREERKKQQK